MKNTLPILIGTIVTVCWNVVGLMFNPAIDPKTSIVREYNFSSRYSGFADVPYLVYSDEFYSGESYNQTKLPNFNGFAERRLESIFDSEVKVVSILLVVLVGQLAFFILMFVNFSIVYRDEKRDKVSVKNL